MKAVTVPNLRRILSDNLRRVLPILDRNLLLSQNDPAAFEPLEQGGLRCACHAAWPTDARLLADWDELSRTVPSAMAFQGPVWQEAAWPLRAGGGRLRLLTVHRGEQLLAVLPLSLTDEGGLETPGAPVTDYLDPLIDASAEPEVWRLVLAFLREAWDRRVKGLTFHNVRENAPCRMLLPALAEETGFNFGERVVEHAPAVRLASSWDEYLNTLDAHERKETRRKLNKAETKGGAKLVICEKEEEIEPSLQKALALMESCGGEKGDAVRKTLRPLLEKAGPELMRRKRLWLTTLLVNGEPAACLLQFPSRSGPMLYNCGFDAAKKEWSPGVVAVAMAIRDAITYQRARTYDLLRGQEPYKYKLGAIDQALYRLDLSKR